MKSLKYVVLRVALRAWTLYYLPMKKRVTTLEVLTEQNQKSIDRLDRSIADLRFDMNCRFTEVDRKFTWLIGMQFTTFIAIIGIFAKLVNIF